MGHLTNHCFKSQGSLKLRDYSSLNWGMNHDGVSGSYKGHTQSNMGKLLLILYAIKMLYLLGHLNAYTLFWHFGKEREWHTATGKKKKGWRDCLSKMLMQKLSVIFSKATFAISYGIEISYLMGVVGTVLWEAMTESHSCARVFFFFPNRYFCLNSAALSSCCFLFLCLVPEPFYALRVYWGPLRILCI